MLELKRKPIMGRNAAKAARPRQHPSSGRGTSAEVVKLDASFTTSAGGIRAVEPRDVQTRVPLITGEAQCRGTMVVDGPLSGQLAGSHGCLMVKQKSNSFFGSAPEFDGEITFKDMVRVNGHIAGSVNSHGGTLIVDIGAVVDANIDVGVAVVCGQVTGDIVARDRVEIGPAARIYGNIWTRSIIIKNGAIFEGICHMLDDNIPA